MDPSKQIQSPSADDNPDKSLGRENTLSAVRNVLKSASKNDGATTVSEVSGINPETALENLQVALKYVKQMVPFSENDLYFTKFPGLTVGEHIGNKKVAVDPIMLMHPANRLAHVIVHEYCHGNDVENEGLVEAKTRALLKKAGLSSENEGVVATEKYDNALDSFYEFSKRVSGDKDVLATVDKIYQLYYEGKYESIYEMYEKNFMNSLKTDNERNEALKFFEKVFPELSIQEKGTFEPIPTHAA